MSFRKGAKPPRSALVLGGGFAGLSAAVHLALGGAQVTLLEKAPELGGKAGVYARDGYRFDTGPSVLTLPRVLSSVFEAAGESLPVALTPLAPLCRYHFASGRVWEVHQNVARTTAQLSRDEAKAYTGLLDLSRRLFEAAAPTFVYGPSPGPAALLRYGLRYGLRAYPGLGLERLLARYRVSPELEPFFLRFATYLGADPFRAPAVTHNVMWAEVGLGAYYPHGGIGRLVQELGTLAARLGVEVVTGAEALSLEVRDGRVIGALTASGTFGADAVVAALDLVHTHKLLGLRSSLEAREPSLSGFVLLLGLEGRSRDLRHHNIFFPRDYESEFRAIRAGRPADDPTLYLSVSAKSDPDQAPEGHENLFVMVNAPALPEGGFDWEHEASFYAELLIERLERRGLKVTPRIRLRHWLTPADFAKTGWRGSLYGHAPHGLRLALKPGQKLRGLDNLVLAGGTVHPGGGIPLAILSGKRAAEALLGRRGQ
ncbi:MAG: phytoene desaturase family protein [Deinococcota bacterium]|nr:phytoene desaturase family protein [Deinococcota bacterium]